MGYLGMVCVLLLLAVLSFAGERTVVLTPEQETTLALVARVRVQSVEAAAQDALNVCLATAGAESTGQVERKLVETFRKLPDTDKDEVIVDVNDRERTRRGVR